MVFNGNGAESEQQYCGDVRRKSHQAIRSGGPHGPTTASPLALHPYCARSLVDRPATKLQSCAESRLSVGQRKQLMMDWKAFDGRLQMTGWVRDGDLFRKFNEAAELPRLRRASA
jgi:hypothetical protein